MKMKHNSSTYSNHGCRCYECRAAWSAYNLLQRQRRKARITPDDPRHGTYTFYLNWSCRCDRCKKANADRSRKLREEAA